MKCYVRGILVACFVGAIAGMPSEGAEPRNSLQDDLVDQVMADCADKDSTSCFKHKLFSYVDRAIGGRDSFSLADGVNVVKTESAEGSPRAYDGKSDNDVDDDVETMFLNRVERFMNTHTFKVDVKGSDVMRAFSNAANSLGLLPNTQVEESRGKKKKAAKILLPLLMAIKLKLLALLPLAIGAIALLAGKALVIGKIALVISIIMALKKLIGNQQKSVTYEIVNHPHHSSHDVWSGGDYGSSGNVGGGHGGGGGGSGGWGRSATDDAAHNMAYKAYQPLH